MQTKFVVPEDPQKPGRDVLGVGLVRRGHFIHEILARQEEPMTSADIGERARSLAAECGASFKVRTFAPDVTNNHLRYMRKRGYAEQSQDRRWRLTAAARQRISESSPAGDGSRASDGREIQAVDARCRVMLPRDFANATVTVERVTKSEIRIQKAVVIPETELPLLEDSLEPLSDRDRDFFLNMLDNPPEPTPAFRAAAAKYNRRHD